MNKALWPTAPKLSLPSVPVRGFRVLLLILIRVDRSVNSLEGAVRIKVVGGRTASGSCLQALPALYCSGWAEST
ncbi:MAG: hypothetical protein FDX21_10315 [Chlorobium sp.]|nr:MAG: hypothetical protein FDX21_10315 [Chlorobium sp.]